ncbi:SH3 domain-containing protein [Staphylococcus pseudintermedius]|uniref:SH3 domain-containing protein n=1 Tax=Staphylococcus pseudintermedius TaxID=283734 RepID=UPI00286E5496|nr:SH3 domain-containing protein [Staphylococcus pseudintermedius]WMZ84827.1 SH3 domain-containing protein [Staphylococcus pseudintermedius]
MTPSQYLPWLYARENNGTHVNGWASVYVNRNEVLWYHPTDYVEWHCGNQWANANLIGFEVCESYPGRISDALFLENEEATLKVVADVMKSYGLAVNRTTVRLHNEFFGTSCPHRSWELHVGKNAPYTTANINKMKDYFIKRIKHYYDGGALKVNKSETIKQEDVKQEVKQQEKKQVVKKTDWNKNKYGTWWKNEQATFKNGNEEIQVWTEGPFRIKGNEAGKLQPGTTINYDEVMLQDGHVWVGYDSFEGERLYLPVREWNGVAPPNHGLGELWGTVK